VLSLAVQRAKTPTIAIVRMAAALRKVHVQSDVYAVCTMHALTTEREEIMGLLLGDISVNTCELTSLTSK
jgi:hypothetical protein